MTVQEQIEKYISSQPEPKRSDIRALHNLVLQIMPSCKLWFLDGKNDDGKIVSNPNIGYGDYNIRYADGKVREFYRIGLSANRTGISIYIMDIDDKKYLPKMFRVKLGKASVTGYCIKFRSIKDIDIDVLMEAIRYGARI